MGQLRSKIREMVRKEFVSRLLAEASTKSVYKSSKYIDLWNSIPKGTSTKEVSPTATKHDFVRRVLSMLNKADVAMSTSALSLTPEQKDEALALLVPLRNDPDEFVETMNKERGLLFGQTSEEGKLAGGKLRSHPDPVAYLLTQYLSDKDVLKSLESVEADKPKAASAKADTEGEYDIIPGTTSKADIARMLSQDPTETTTEMSVLNRLAKAMKHLTNDQNMAILGFIKDPNVDREEKVSIMADLQSIQDLVGKAASKYAELFVDSQVNAAKGIRDIENFEEVEKARELGIKKFIQALRDAGAFSTSVNKDDINPAEYDVFDAVLDMQLGRHDLHGMTIIAAKRPDRVLFRDEAVAAAKQAFTKEQNKQTNFNTLGDFTDAMPEMKELRQNIFHTLEKRGRKPGSTKEVLAAKKAAATKR
jgi:hypothetical protein